MGTFANQQSRRASLLHHLHSCQCSTHQGQGSQHLQDLHSLGTNSTQGQNPSPLLWLWWWIHWTWLHHIPPARHQAPSHHPWHTPAQWCSRIPEPPPPWVHLCCAPSFWPPQESLGWSTVKLSLVEESNIYESPSQQHHPLQEALWHQTWPHRHPWVGTIYLASLWNGLKTWHLWTWSMMDQIWCWQHTHPLGLLAQQAIHFHQTQHQVQLPQLHPLPREPPTTSSDSATTFTSTWTTSSCTASGTTSTASTSGTSNAASDNSTTTSITPCTTKAANAWSITISSYHSANSTSILTLPSP